MEWTVTETQVFWIGWTTVILWTLFSLLATIDAIPLYLINRETYRAAKVRDDHKLLEIGTKGDLRKSRNFLIGFFLSSFTGLMATTGRIFAPPEPDTSSTSIILSSILILMIFFFWRAKHADRVTLKQQARYTQDYAPLTRIESKQDAAAREAEDRYSENELEKTEVRSKLEAAEEETRERDVVSLAMVNSKLNQIIAMLADK